MTASAYLDFPVPEHATYNGVRLHLVRASGTVNADGDARYDLDAVVPAADARDLLVPGCVLQRDDGSAYSFLQNVFVTKVLGAHWEVFQRSPSGLAKVSWQFLGRPLTETEALRRDLREMIRAGAGSP